MSCEVLLSLNYHFWVFMSYIIALLKYGAGFMSWTFVVSSCSSMGWVCPAAQTANSLYSYLLTCLSAGNQMEQTGLAGELKTSIKRVSYRSFMQFFFFFSLCLYIISQWEENCHVHTMLTSLPFFPSLGSVLATFYFEKSYHSD